MPRRSRQGWPRRRHAIRSGGSRPADVRNQGSSRYSSQNDAGREGSLLCYRRLGHLRYGMDAMVAMDGEMSAMPRRLIVGITGASGSIFGIRLLERLRELDIETHLVLSRWGARTLVHETNYSV